MLAFVATATALLLEVHALRGPYPSAPAYTTSAKRDWGARRCKTGPLATRRAAKGVIEAAWLRCEVSIAGARAEECALAVRSAKGWYIDSENRVRCGGRLGPLSTVKGRLARLTWKDDVLWATFDVETLEGEWSERQGGGKEAVYARPEKNRWLVLCGAGQSGVPSCSETLVLGCSSGDRSTTVSARIRRRTLVLAAGDDGDCDRGEILVGTFRLYFQ